MKQLSRMLTVAVLVAVGVTVVQAEPISAKVQRGTAQAAVDGKTWNSVHEGDLIPEGATIRTQSNPLDLYLGANGPLLRVKPDSEVVLAVLNREKGAGETIANTEIKVTKGQIVGLTTKVNAASKYQVKAGATTTWIRGTKFAVKSNGRVAVKEGLATVVYTAVAGTMGTKFSVRDGNVFEPQGNAGGGSVGGGSVGGGSVGGGSVGGGSVGDGSVGDGKVGAMSPQEELAVADDLDMMVSSMQASFGRYVPSPSWKVPQRPFDPPGNRSDPPWSLPPVHNPTTPVNPTAPGGN